MGVAYGYGFEVQSVCIRACAYDLLDYACHWTESEQGLYPSRIILLALLLSMEGTRPQ